ncbi:hypothetical protein SEA_BOOMERJR_38 [Streptomyces phage BoomerJR]|uniref:Uncharacterized protein n=2 Tax=Streptomyces virus Yaboi TaxID=2846408 RepID=A0A411C4E1_9CAUD|nr:hypothetical protein SEA_GENIE2_38 [Streptomyces phage Genie2]QAY12690.1 hypothetical protein SEA_BOOMERJR_38 [Streptomyces phage BoomerJR]UVD39886.1 hypothetical protein SEA_STANIMAL_38 [Streptomyces phage Stanimal]WNM73627.1 hypothetical protein SEA_SOLLERTIA_38 [Streptomyces phage Sollertia]
MATERCFIKQCQKSANLKIVSFHGRKVKMCPEHREANKYLK